MCYVFLLFIYCRQELTIKIVRNGLFDHFKRRRMIMIMKNSKKLKRAFTHGGKFHADDVFGAALLSIVFPGIKIERGFQVPENYEGIVFDIGFGEFDHHQADKEVRENGIPYAAFGLLWRKFGTSILSEEKAQIFDEKFVQAIDLTDNTGERNELSTVIASFNPSWNEEVDSDDCFMQALHFAKEILQRRFRYYKDEELAEGIVEAELAKSEDGILVLPRFVPWKSKVLETDVKFVVFPSLRGGYNAQAVPISEENTDLRVPFPEEWRGKTPEELKKFLDGMTFCHSGGFLIAADKLDTVIKACKMAMENH